jgi:hypothetical protein
MNTILSCDDSTEVIQILHEAKKLIDANSVSSFGYYALGRAVLNTNCARKYAGRYVQQWLYTLLGSCRDLEEWYVANYLYSVDDLPRKCTIEVGDFGEFGNHHIRGILK